MSREMKLPGPDHQITIAPSSDRVVVRSGETTIADSQSTLVLRETNHPPVRYIPLADVDRSLLTPSDLTTYCPYKGDASYYSIIADPAARHRRGLVLRSALPRGRADQGSRRVLSGPRRAHGQRPRHP